MKSAALALGLAVPALRPAVPALPAFAAPMSAPDPREAPPPAPAVVAPSHAYAPLAAPQAAGLPPLVWSRSPSERVPVYYRAAFARALEENASLVAPSADGADGIRLRSFAEHAYAWEVEAAVSRAGAETARLRVFLGKHDGRVAIVPAE